MCRDGCFATAHAWRPGNCWRTTCAPEGPESESQACTNCGATDGDLRADCEAWLRGEAHSGSRGAQCGWDAGSPCSTRPPRPNRGRPDKCARRRVGRRSPGRLQSIYSDGSRRPVVACCFGCSRVGREPRRGSQLLPRRESAFASHTKTPESRGARQPAFLFPDPPHRR